LRGKVWKLFLNVTEISASSYIHLVELGPSSLDDKIRNDTFRTMTTDTKFIEHVSEDMLIRLLNAFVWTNDGKRGSNIQNSHIYSLFISHHRQEKDARSSNMRKQFNCHRVNSLTYVQGMNVLAAPFLMVMPEMEAFYGYSTFIWKWCPLYVQPTMKGVHCGLRVKY
jgi:cell cycle arrest protein BUB2